jgi:hypothetical protein
MMNRKLRIAEQHDGDEREIFFRFSLFPAASQQPAARPLPASSPHFGISASLAPQSVFHTVLSFRRLAKTKFTFQNCSLQSVNVFRLKADTACIIRTEAAGTPLVVKTTKNRLILDI